MRCLRITYARNSIKAKKKRRLVRAELTSQLTAANWYRKNERANKKRLTGRCFMFQPQNLVMMGSFPECEVKLCDFEISRVILEGTEVREILGTPDYVGKQPFFARRLHFVVLSRAISWHANKNSSKRNPTDKRDVISIRRNEPAGFVSSSEFSSPWKIYRVFQKVEVRLKARNREREKKKI